jgi:GNAT superfamily N-acetyltransferase
MIHPGSALDGRAIEAASAEYLCARVAALLSVKGNPHQAGIRSHGPLKGFLVQATTSPMVNRIVGDSKIAPAELTELLAWFTLHRCVAAIPLIVHARRPAATEMFGPHKLRRLNGWTHLQFVSSIDGTSLASSTVDVEEVTPDSMGVFAKIHAEAFHTPPAGQPVNRASFSGLLAGNNAKGFIARVDGRAVAGAIVYFAKNGIAYLATAATRREARGRGCHSALIGCRIAAARERGCQFVVATATPNSQSRRNLERFGLTASHMQALYRSAS